VKAANKWFAIETLFVSIAGEDRDDVRSITSSKFLATDASLAQMISITDRLKENHTTSTCIISTGQR
jgi:hypothetical protein